jgi:hypothetical protein
MRAQSCHGRQSRVAWGKESGVELPLKDVFIIHSKGDEREGALASALIERLAAVDISVYVYEDWNWEHKVRRSGRGHYRSTGRLEELDLVRHSQGHPYPFRSPIDEIDEATLGEMLHDSKVVLLCEPRQEGPSPGVLAESRVLANLAAGPILVHLLWSDSSGDLFASLRPMLELRLAEPQADAAFVDELFAAMVLAWLVYMLQRRWSRAGGSRLLAKVGSCEPTLKRLAETSPQHSEFDGAETVSTENTTDSGTQMIREMFAGFGQFEEEQFAEWRTECVGKLRPHIQGLQGGDCVRILRQLLNA